MPENVNDRTVFSLLEVAKSIQKTVSERYKSLYWIKAEMNKLNHYSHSGHCYPELVEKKEGKIVAEMRSILWKTDFHRINEQFKKLLNEPLRDGITILFQAGISYDPMYGFSLRIVDIDPSFVLGELEREKKESIQRLVSEGLFDANKRLPFPILPKRLAIISVETSKGLSDFYKIIRNNPWGYRFETTLYPALLQGDKSVSSIINQLAVIAERTEAYDAVAIIRGGGGEVGLSSYNNYLLARAIAIFQIPVITGIGHSTNETVSEMVSYKNAITPSELADFLIQKFHNFSIPLDKLQEKLYLSALRHFEHRKQQLNTLAQSLNWASSRIITEKQTALKSAHQSLAVFSRQVLKDQYKELESFSRLLQIADPKQLLRRGFSITKINGKVITSAEQLKEGQEIDTQFFEGTAHSTVNRIDHGN